MSDSKSRCLAYTTYILSVLLLLLLLGHFCVFVTIILAWTILLVRCRESIYGLERIVEIFAIRGCICDVVNGPLCVFFVNMYYLQSSTAKEGRLYIYTPRLRY